MATSRKRIAARVFFLGVTATALVTECWFAWDGDPETDPWTDLIGDYVPWQVALAVFGALLLWVPAHFWVRYKREAAERARDKALLVRAVEANSQRANMLAEFLHEEMPDRYDTRGNRIIGGESPEQETLF